MRKTTAWNEFSSTMASAIICLATNQKFNFSKFIFEGMIKNLDNVSGKFLMYPRKPRRKDTQVTRPSDPSDNVTDEAVHKELCNSLVRAATTASNLEAEKGNGNTLRSDEDRPKLNELMKLCTTLQKKVIDLEKTKLTQTNEIASLKRRVKELEKKRSSRTYKLKRLYKGKRSNAIDADEDITLVNVQDDAGKEMMIWDALNVEEVFVAGQNENIVEEDKGKGIMIEEPVKPMKKKVQIMLDEEVALKLQAEFDEEERLNMEGKKLKDLKNKSFDSIQKMFDRAFKRVISWLTQNRLGGSSSKRLSKWLIMDQQDQWRLRICYYEEFEGQCLNHIRRRMKSGSSSKRRIVGIKSLLNAASITAAHIRVNAA
ncbi:hypothetical protein Tco_1466031 [Tanacetum coccineum]